MVEITRSEGTTPSEKYLAQLCERSFLDLWSYPNLYRDQGRRGTEGCGKELCDLLVVCGDHVVIFSDKSIAFQADKDADVAWPRWFRRAVLESADQVRGAERWLVEHPDRVFLDASCARRLPLDLPPAASRKVHRVLVAGGAEEACRKEHPASSGTLRVLPGIRGDDHIERSATGYRRFAVGDLDPQAPFVHVFSPIALELTLKARDTITDFVRYLEKREAFLRGDVLRSAAGEEQLLACFLLGMNADDEHDFVPSTVFRWDPQLPLDLPQGLWDELESRPEFVAKVEADRKSYFWDKLIGSFSKHVLGGTMLGGNPLTDQEKALRFLALESRLQRRALSEGFIEAIEAAEPDRQLMRTVVRRPGAHGWQTCYVFLQLPMAALEGCSDEDVYRQVRRNMLFALCKITRGKFKHPLRVVGIAMEPPKHAGESGMSQDICLLEEEWSEGAESAANELAAKLGVYHPGRVTTSSWRGWEFPLPSETEGRSR